VTVAAAAVHTAATATSSPRRRPANPLVKDEVMLVRDVVIQPSQNLVSVTCLTLLTVIIAFLTTTVVTLHVTRCL
jgi:hypothetical protein